MLHSYLYVTRSITNQKALRHHVYKVGISTDPYTRIRTLGSAGSTETYEPIVVLPLPCGVKDTHILAHRMVKKFVLFSSETLQRQYAKIFGKEHLHALKRRRELVMFGSGFSLTRVKSLFQRVLRDISTVGHKNHTKKGLYVCRDTSCTSIIRCGVCTKFIRSVWNGIAYQKSSMYRDPLASFGQSLTRKRKLELLEKVEAKFVKMTEERPTKRTRRRQPDPRWQGPMVDEYWLLRPNISMIRSGHRFLIGKVVSNNDDLRTSRVQWWLPRNVTGLQNMRMAVDTIFVEDNTISPLMELPWDNGGWQRSIRMTRSDYKQIWKVDGPTVIDFVKRWTSRSCGVRLLGANQNDE
jgi:hypothetical protein